MKDLICKTCVYYKPVESLRGYCFSEPPKVLLMPIAVNKPDIKNAMQQEVTMQPASVRPVVGEGDFCSKWAFRMNQATH